MGIFDFHKDEKIDQGNTSEAKVEAEADASDTQEIDAVPSFRKLRTKTHLPQVPTLSLGDEPAIEVATPVAVAEQSQSTVPSAVPGAKQSVRFDGANVSFDLNFILENIPQELCSAQWKSLLKHHSEPLQFALADVLAVLSQGVFRITAGPLCSLMPAELLSPNAMQSEEIISLPIAVVVAALPAQAFVFESDDRLLKVILDMDDVFKRDAFETKPHTKEIDEQSLEETISESSSQPATSVTQSISMTNSTRDTAMMFARGRESQLVADPSLMETSLDIEEAKVVEKTLQPKFPAVHAEKGGEVDGDGEPEEFVLDLDEEENYGDLPVIQQVGVKTGTIELVSSGSQNVEADVHSVILKAEDFSVLEKDLSVSKDTLLQILAQGHARLPLAEGGEVQLPFASVLDKLPQNYLGFPEDQSTRLVDVIEAMADVFVFDKGDVVVAAPEQESPQKEKPSALEETSSGDLISSGAFFDNLSDDEEFDVPELEVEEEVQETTVFRTPPLVGEVAMPPQHQALARDKSKSLPLMHSEFNLDRNKTMFVENSSNQLNSETMGTTIRKRNTVSGIRKTVFQFGAEAEDHDVRHASAKKENLDETHERGLPVLGQKGSENPSYDRQQTLLKVRHSPALANPDGVKTDTLERKTPMELPKVMAALRLLAPNGVDVNICTREDLLAFADIDEDVADCIMEFLEAKRPLKCLTQLMSIEEVDEPLYFKLTGLEPSINQLEAEGRLYQIAGILPAKEVTVRSLIKACFSSMRLQSLILSDIDGTTVASEGKVTLAGDVSEESLAAGATQLISRLHKHTAQALLPKLNQVTVYYDELPVTFAFAGELYLSAIHKDRYPQPSDLEKLENFRAELQWFFSRRLIVGS